MSKRRSPGEIVRRTPGSGFCGSSDPEFVRVPDDPEEIDYCMLDCGDPLCREYANLKVLGGPHDGKTLCHIAECQMEDAETP